MFLITSVAFRRRGKKHRGRLARLSFAEMALVTGLVMQHAVQRCVHKIRHDPTTSDFLVKTLDNNIPNISTPTHARKPQAVPSKRTSARIDMRLDEVKARLISSLRPIPM